MNEKHFRALEAMYQSAPFHNILPPVRLSVEPGACSLASVITSDLFMPASAPMVFRFSGSSTMPRFLPLNHWKQCIF